jgi:hypothetical protein
MHFLISDFKKLQDVKLSIGLPYFLAVAEQIQERYGHWRFKICISHIGETSICIVPQWFVQLKSSL